MRIKVSNANAPTWKEVNVKSQIPESLKCLDEMAHNLWWAWNYNATDLFKDMDPDLWKEVKQNPVLLLQRLSYESLEKIAKNRSFIKKMNDVYSDFRKYMDVKKDSKRP